MISIKKLIFKKLSYSQRLSIIEYFGSNGESIYSWPGSLLLSLYLFHIEDEVRNKKILEIGCGNAIPSLLCTIIGADEVDITDRSGETLTYEIIKSQIKLNEIKGKLKLYPLDWGNLADIKGSYDFIIGADIFYNTEDFDDIFFTIWNFLLNKPDTIFLTAYQNRCTFRTICPYLTKYGLHAIEILKGSFISENTTLISDSQDFPESILFEDTHLIKIFMK